MKVEQVLELVKAVSDSALTEFKYEEDGVKLSLKKTEDKIVQVQAPSVPMSMPGVMPVSAPLAPVQGMAAGNAVPGGVTAGTGSASAAGNDPAAAESGNTQAALSGKVVKSPLVGTFYAAPAEDAEPFVKVGDSIKEGQVLAIVEAMKLMNEIESDFAGTVTEILVENGQAVEYGQPLMVIG